MEKRPLADSAVNPKIVLLAAWTVLLCLYLYCDLFSLYRPGQLAAITGGKMGFLDVTQASLLLASVLMVVPSLMILLSVATPAAVSRTINLVVAPVYLVVNLGNLVGEAWGYYYLFGVLEIGVVAFLFVAALRWPRPGQPGDATLSP